MVTADNNYILSSAPSLPSSLDHHSPLLRELQGKGMVKLETEPGNKRSKKQTSNEALKAVEERKSFDLDSYVQLLIHENTKVDANLADNPAKESVEKKKRKKRRSRKADDNKDDTQRLEQTDTMLVRSLSDEHRMHENQDKLKKVEPDLEQEVKGSSVDNENSPSVELSPRQDKRRKKRRRMEEKGNDKESTNTVDQTDIMSMGILSGEHCVQGNANKLERVGSELKQEVEGSFVDDENTAPAKVGVERKKKGRERRMKEKANDEDGTLSMGGVSEEHGVRGEEDKLKRVENELEQEIGGSFMDDENTASAKECVGKRKKERRERRMNGKANDKDGAQRMDQADTMSMGSLNEEHGVQGNEDKLKRVENELEQEIGGSFVDDENTESAKECVGKRKKGRRERRMNGQANDKDGTQSMDQVDTMSVGSLSEEHGVRGSEDKLKRVENELEQEECVGKKKKGRKERRVKEKANDEDGMQNKNQTDIMSMGSLSDERGVRGNKDKIKRVEDELEQEVEEGSIVDVEQKKKGMREKRMKGNANDNDGTQIMDQTNVRSMISLQGSKDELKRVENELEKEVERSLVVAENTASAKEGKKERRRRRRKDRRANAETCTQIVDQMDIMSIRSVSDEPRVEGNGDKSKGVDDKSEQEVEGTVVNDENTQSANQSAEPKKERRRKKNRKANDKDDNQSMDQGNKEKLERVEPELEREVEQSFVNGENTPSTVEGKKKRRKKKNKNRKANADKSMQSEHQTVDNSLKTSIPSPGKSLGLFSKRKLLILDLNGLLADIVHPPPKHCRADTNIARRAIFKRPFYYDFLKFCFERFDVGIWSSRSKRIIDLVVDYLLGNLKHKLLFCWDTSYCTVSGFKTLENVHKPLVFKELRKIWEKSDPNFPREKGYYDESNTLLLDDSPYKALINPKNTAIFPRSYTFRNRGDNSLGPGGDLRVYLEQVAEAENIQKYVEQHPFGQVGIDETSRSWGFYSKVLSRRSVVLPSTTQNSVCLPA